ncbi:MAG: aspartate kinase [Sphingobacteriales bacterium]|nr:MAG: aspartate kinase [Sphingobacteriales bacterium]
MKVYKFGGASIKDAKAIKNVAKILVADEPNQILIVVSAMGKTTNALEKLAQHYFEQKNDCSPLLEAIKTYHYTIIEALFEDKNHAVYNEVNNFFVEIEWVLEDEPQDEFNFIYDQLVAMGELIASCIVSNYLNLSGILNQWADARAYLQTNNNYRSANINWPVTEALIVKTLPTILKNKLVVTQGFIGNTSENFTTTLGREGSDYTAAIFGNCLNADSVTIWKDVPGVLNADPKLFKRTVKFETLSYGEAIEMAYYGATVIHPKTLKPLQNKNIPLFVKPFMASHESGTKICETQKAIKTPIIIVKNNQVLISISTKNVSFINHNHLKNIFVAFADVNLQINTMQVSALTFSACFDFEEHQFNTLSKILNNEFNLRYNTNLQLITVRHYTPAVLKKLSQNKEIILEQLSRSTAQLVLKYKIKE